LAILFVAERYTTRNKQVNISVWYQRDPSDFPEEIDLIQKESRSKLKDQYKNKT